MHELDTFIEADCPSEDSSNWKSIDQLFDPDGAIVLKFMKSCFVYEDDDSILNEGVNADPKHRHFINLVMRVYTINKKGGWDVEYQAVLLDDNDRFCILDDNFKIVKIRQTANFTEELERLRSVV